MKEVDIDKLCGAGLAKFGRGEKVGKYGESFEGSGRRGKRKRRGENVDRGEKVSGARERYLERKKSRGEK